MTLLTLCLDSRGFIATSSRPTAGRGAFCSSLRRHGLTPICWKRLGETASILVLLVLTWRVLITFIHVAPRYAHTGRPAHARHTLVHSTLFQPYAQYCTTNACSCPSSWRLTPFICKPRIRLYSTNTICRGYSAGAAWPGSRHLRLCRRRYRQGGMGLPRECDMLWGY